MNGQDNPKGKRPTRVKNVVTPEDTLPWGPRRKNLSTSCPHSPLPFEAEKDVASSSKENS